MNLFWYISMYNFNWMTVFGSMVLNANVTFITANVTFITQVWCHRWGGGGGGGGSGGQLPPPPPPYDFTCVYYRLLAQRSVMYIH